MLIIEKTLKNLLVARFPNYILTMYDVDDYWKKQRSHFWYNSQEYLCLWRLKCRLDESKSWRIYQTPRGYWIFCTSQVVDKCNAPVGIDELHQILNGDMTGLRLNKKEESDFIPYLVDIVNPHLESPELVRKVKGLQKLWTIVHNDRNALADVDYEESRDKRGDKRYMEKATLPNEHWYIRGVRKMYVHTPCTMAKILTETDIQKAQSLTIRAHLWADLLDLPFNLFDIPAGMEKFAFWNPATGMISDIRDAIKNVTCVHGSDDKNECKWCEECNAPPF